MNELQQIPTENAFSSGTFEHAQRVAQMLSKSALVPKEFQGNVQNVMIALELANRIGASPLMVMQNLYLVHGKPSWSSSFIIATINSTKRFEPLRFDVKGTGDDLSCIAWTTERGKEHRIEGPPVTMAMAKAEGWYDKKDKNGNFCSKWRTMPELMIRYRAAAFFGRLYAPEIMMGMQTQEEVYDIQHGEVNQEEVKRLKEAQRVEMLINDAQTVEELDALVEHVGDGQMELFQSKLKMLKEAE